MDEHVPRAMTNGLRLRGVDVVTAAEDGKRGAADSELVSGATELGRVLFTQDDDLLVEASCRLRGGISFSGIVYAHPLRVSIGAIVEQGDLITTVDEPEDLEARVEFLPLK